MKIFSALITWLLFGFFGGHRLYLGYKKSGFIMLMFCFLAFCFVVADKKDLVGICTGILSLWWLLDFILILNTNFVYKNEKIKISNEKKEKLANINKLFELYRNNEINLDYEDISGVNVFKKYAQHPELLHNISENTICLLSQICIEFQKRIDNLNAVSEIDLIEKRHLERKFKKC